MARKLPAIRSVSSVAIPSVDDEATDRALTILADEIRKLQARASEQDIDADLVVGTNLVPHTLGRAPSRVQVTPTVANASFAWAWVRTNFQPDRFVQIDVIGVAQPGAVVTVS